MSSTAASAGCVSSVEVARSRAASSSLAADGSSSERAPADQRGGDPLLRLGRVEREQDAERGPRVSSVVARLREESRDRGGVTARRRLDVVDACERAPRPRVAAEEVAPELDGIHRLDGLDETLRGERCARVERDSEKVEPRLAFAVAHVRERSAELVRLVATRAGGSRERDEQRERGACGHVYGRRRRSCVR